jgi:hypothetical protein
MLIYCHTAMILLHHLNAQCQIQQYKEMNGQLILVLATSMLSILNLLEEIGDMVLRNNP